MITLQGRNMQLYECCIKLCSTVVCLLLINTHSHIAYCSEYNKLTSLPNVNIFLLPASSLNNAFKFTHPSVLYVQTFQISLLQSLGVRGFHCSNIWRVTPCDLQACLQNYEKRSFDLSCLSACPSVRMEQLGSY